MRAGLPALLSPGAASSAGGAMCTGLGCASACACALSASWWAGAAGKSSVAS